MSNKLTVVIPVLNEGEELAITLKQIASEKMFLECGGCGYTILLLILPFE